MKALTIWQPYASLIAVGAKKYETRSWRTDYRGLIAIHAALRPMGWIIEHTDEAVLQIAARIFGTEAMMDLPNGKIVAFGRLTDCLLMTPELIEGQTPQEIALGDWTSGRYAWRIEDVEAVEPIDIKGKQGLWTLDLCSVCRYDTNDFVAHPHCGGCDGVSKFERRKRHEVLRM